MVATGASERKTESPPAAAARAQHNLSIAENVFAYDALPEDVAGGYTQMRNMSKPPRVNHMNKPAPVTHQTLFSSDLGDGATAWYDADDSQNADRTQRDEVHAAQRGRGARQAQRAPPARRACPAHRERERP